MLFLGYTALLLSWMHCAAERACTEPPPRRVKELPTELWDKPPYPHGTQVTYRCRPGYIKVGRIVFECADGRWKQRLPGAECRNKPCGHPGDIEFGSFELTTGSAFVFGARVEYRCDDGYWMLSQRNYRECQADGWSNDLPHCEVAKCLPVEAPENGRIITTGTFERDREYSFGQVVNFECNAEYKLVGDKELICSSNGQWSSDVPQCQEILCNVPKIMHGYVRSSRRTFKESEKLQFSCDEGYAYGERADVRCTEAGWNPTPYCTEITCSPPKVSKGTFRPQEDNYKAGAIITIQCEPGYRFKALTGKTTSECTKNGWVPEPSCVQKKCDYPAIENGRLSSSLEYYRYFYFPMMAGQHIDYYCFPGYSTPTGESWVRAACTGGDWSPEPKCLKQCYIRDPENGYFLHGRNDPYKEGERAKYTCDINYYTEHENGEVTCTKDDWSPPPKCIRKKMCQKTDFDNGYFTARKQTFALEEVVRYSCHPGFVTLKGEEKGTVRCRDKGLTPLPKCIKSCNAPYLDILNYPANKTLFIPEDTIEYACLEGYQTANKTPTGTTRCGINGEWSPTPQCLAIECEMPSLPNGDFSPKMGVYHNGDVVNFTCANNYVRLGPASAQCYYFGWFPSPPLCKASPTGCGPPPEITNGTITEGIVEQYQHGARMQYECNIEFKLVGSKEIECVDGQWSSPPSCIEDKTPCRSPSSLPNVVLYQQDQPQFSHGDEVICGCKKHFRSSKGKKIRCLNGEWKPFPLCADPYPQCALPRDVELVRNNRASKMRQESELPAIIHYKCTSADKSTKQAICVSGKWSPEIECGAVKTLCPPPPQVPGAQQITVGKNYKNGSKIPFSCLESFQLIGANEITCVEGKWQSPPHCVARSCLPPQPPECADGSRLETQHLEIKKNGERIYLDGARLKYFPRSGYKLLGPPVITCSMGNWTSAPICLEMPCGSIPKVANAQAEGRDKETFEPGETINYRCDAGFLVVGSPEIICREGNWTAAPFCKDVACGAPPEIPSADITSVQKERYLPGARVHYECKSRFQVLDENYITCTNGEWSKPPACRDITCEPPPEIAGGTVQGAKKARYVPGENARYQCWQGLEMSGTATVTCHNGTWTELPKCKGITRTCGPPPVIENGDLLSFPMQEYPQGTTLTYKCPSFYNLEGSPNITCNNGQWTRPPVCLVACTASAEDMNTNNIELKWSNKKKLYATSGDVIEFRCKRGYMEDPASSPFRVLCMEGILEYPQCKPAKDCIVNRSILDRNHITLQSPWQSPSTYSTGDYILFRCYWNYRQVSRPEEFRVQCKNGVIAYPVCG
ncbi:complement factor H isoform X1 [Melanerpes formicivorus]|uniref:complement factor H isoform X1 n=1 Tax=Melanerpes formicivorus TaxID=211600 RepID=UPI00358EA7C5